MYIYVWYMCVCICGCVCMCVCVCLCVYVCVSGPISRVCHRPPDFPWYLTNTDIHYDCDTLFLLLLRFIPSRLLLLPINTVTPASAATRYTTYQYYDYYDYYDYYAYIQQLLSISVFLPVCVRVFLSTGIVSYSGCNGEALSVSVRCFFA